MWDLGNVPWARGGGHVWLPSQARHLAVNLNAGLSSPCRGAAVALGWWQLQSSIWGRAAGGELAEEDPFVLGSSLPRALGTLLSVTRRATEPGFHGKALSQSSFNIC